MGRHAVSVTIPCPDCGAAAVCTHVAEARRGVLRTHESLQCHACGLAQEADGAELTAAARAAFCATEGRWQTVLHDLQHSADYNIVVTP